MSAREEFEKRVQIAGLKYVEEWSKRQHVFYNHRTLEMRTDFNEGYLAGAKDPVVQELVRAAKGHQCMGYFEDCSICKAISNYEQATQGEG